MNPKRVIIIGGGPGGYVGAIRSAQLGAKVILIEKDRMGGTCLHRGCIPTKALLSDARLLRSLRGSPVFQSLLNTDFDPFGSMMDRKKKVVQEMVAGLEMLLESHRVTVRYGEADLSGPGQVTLVSREKTMETMEGDAIILAPGSKPKAIPGLTVDGERIITSEEALDIGKVPQEIVIIGGGYIGVEFATLFNTLGARVTIIEVLDNLLPGLEEEMVRSIRRSLEGRGVRILIKSAVEDIACKEEKVKLTVKTPQTMEEVTGERVLLAVGRAPCLDLHFARAGVDVTPAGIRVNRCQETTAPRIYAVGDATGGTLLAHVASEEGRVAAENAMGLDRRMEDHPVPFCIFTHPEAASIGLTEKEARAGQEIKVGRFPFRSNPTALISGETEGLIKVVASQKEDTVLGVHIVGPEASGLISIAALAMKKGGKVRDFSDLVQAHPTLPEAMKEAFLDIDGKAIHLPRPLRRPKG